MRRFLLPLSAILLAALLVPLFGSSSVNAAYVVDCVQITDDICIEDVDDIKDLLNNGPVVMQNQQQEDTRDYWLSVLDQDISTFSLGVYQSYYVNSNNPCVVLTASNGNATISSIDQLTFDDVMYTSTICAGASYPGYVTFMSISGNLLQTRTANSTASQFSLPDTLSQYGINYLYPLFITGGVTYPIDYDGDDIPGSAGAEVIRPRFTYDVVDRDVTATHMPRAAALPTYPNDQYSIEWFVRKCLDWDDTTNSCGEYEENNTHYEITPSGGTTSFQVPSYGYYKISAGYLIGGCTRYPSYPATPDYCYYTAPENTEDYEYTITAMMWDIDGSSFSGDTDDDSLICDVSGFCEPPPFNCADVYSDNFVMRLSCSMQQDMDFGLVNPSLFAIKDLMQSMTVPDNPQCDIPLTNVSLAPGYTFPLASYSSVACAKAAEVRTAIPILSVFINFMLAMLSIWMVVRIINKLFDEKDHNIIEGV